jgi:hypothetical protein
MASSAPPPLVINTLRGGRNDIDPPASLPDDQCVLVENIDYERATIGGRRRGQIAVTTSGATINTGAYFLHRHLPTGDETESQLWVTSVSGTTGTFNYKDTAWHAVSPTDLLATASGQYAIRGQTLHGKLFLAYPLQGSVDRLMVWDGSTLRRTGLAEPAAPVVTTSGSGAFATTRYYRVRYSVATGPFISQRLSEPSETTAFSPPGSGAGATITKPAAINEGETHWIIEESINNADFYSIGEIVVGTTTFVDTNDPGTVTGGTFLLAPPIGTYTLEYSPKFLLADSDRLVLGGAWQQSQLQSRISWTPVYASVPPYGNDERLDDNNDPFIDLDGYDGGALTDMGGPVAGYMYAFKWQRIFKLIRTGNVKQAYQAIKVTSAVGAFPRSVVPGVDEQGRECLYFLDPEQGPKRIGANGLESCGEDLGGTWKTLNKNALLVSHGVYYPLRRQVQWWVALTGTTPDTRIVANTRAFTPSTQGVRRGWSFYTGTGNAALASCLYADNINTNGARSLTLKPITGHLDTTLLRINDSGTTDVGTLYQGRIRTKPFVLGGMLERPAIRAGALMATAASGVSVYVTLIRDFGKETGTPIAVDLTPSGTETTVMKPIDNLALSDLLSVQVELGDAAPVDADWELAMASFVVTPGESA